MNPRLEWSDTAAKAAAGQLVPPIAPLSATGGSMKATTLVTLSPAEQEAALKLYADKKARALKRASRRKVKAKSRKRG